MNMQDLQFQSFFQPVKHDYMQISCPSKHAIN